MTVYITESAELSEKLRPICVLDLEAMPGTNDCLFCGKGETAHIRDPMIGGHLGELRCVVAETWLSFRAVNCYQPTTPELSIGCYWDSRDRCIHWFDGYTLEETVRYFVETQPLLVSFNGIAFDFSIMRGLLRQEAERQQNRLGYASDACLLLWRLCDAFKVLCTDSYDLLAEIWKVDPSRRWDRDLNSLEALAKANGFGSKRASGIRTPAEDWRNGFHATVLNDCATNVWVTRKLFTLICSGAPIVRGDGQTLELACPAELILHA